LQRRVPVYFAEGGDQLQQKRKTDQKIGPTLAWKDRQKRVPTKKKKVRRDYGAASAKQRERSRKEKGRGDNTAKRRIQPVRTAQKK